MTEPASTPGDVADISRMQSFWRGGTGGSAVDRSAAQDAQAAYPQLAASVRANRAFLGRSVRFLAAECGIRQFLDIGTGLPAPGAVHEVAREIAPDCRVVYCDNDPAVVSRARTEMTAVPTTSRPMSATPTAWSRARAPCWICRRRSASSSCPCCT